MHEYDVCTYKYSMILERSNRAYKFAALEFISLRSEVFVDGMRRTPKQHKSISSGT